MDPAAAAPPAPPPGLDATRLFVVCGKNVEPTTLDALFRPHGDIKSIKLDLIKDKGIAYVRYARASHAAAAIEALHDTQPGGAGAPTLRVLLADPPAGKKENRAVAPAARPPAVTTDPDDHPPRSRVFLVVPRAADPAVLAAALTAISPPGSLAWFKGDLVPSKGVAYAKFHAASAALATLEAIADGGGVLAGHRVKAMLAEPRPVRTAGASGGTTALSASTSTAAPSTSTAAAAPAASGASWDGAAAASRGSAPDASTSSRRSGRGRRRRGTRGSGGGGGQTADDAATPATLSLPALHALAAMRGGLGPLGGRGWGADASLFSGEGGGGAGRPPPAPAARATPSPSPSSDSVARASGGGDDTDGARPSRRRRAEASATSAAAAVSAADVAAVREGLAHMRTADDVDVDLAALGLEAAAGDDGAAKTTTPLPSCPPNRTVYTTLTRPLPAYALEHVLSAHGALVSVALRPGAPQHAIAVFADARAARAARDALHGSRVLGEGLSVALVDPLGDGAGVPSTKRQRVGGGGE